ncbi:MAG: hypothetical protein U5K54_01165 [Cytophagales bacterium]|nr:hypothetical protein [Cytophagales bacterium]
MKKLIVLSLFLISALSAFAQDPTDADLVVQDPKAQEKIKNLRIAYISDKLGLTPDQAEKFWPVYREFSDQRKGIRQEMIDARKQIKTDNPIRRSKNS